MEDLWHKTKTTFCFGLMAQDGLLIYFSAVNLNLLLWTSGTRRSAMWRICGAFGKEDFTRLEF